MYTEEQLVEVKKQLQDDTKYYGKYGKQFLSNSDIRTLLNNPADYGKPIETTKALIQGRYFHTAMLEPNKLQGYNLVDSASRNTKVYKEAIEDSGADMLMLNKEANECLDWVAAMKGSLKFFDDIYDPNNQYEVPGVEKIRGVWWKGKADIVCEDILIDLKTTSDIQNFQRSAKRYNYDSQCYIYQQIFGKPLVFYVIDKMTNQLGIFPPSESFIMSGRDKVMMAIDQYEKFYGENPTEDVSNFIIQETLI